MQHQFLLFTTSLALLFSALLGGCDNKKKEAVSPAPSIAVPEPARPAVNSGSTITPSQPPQQLELKLQTEPASPVDLANLAIGEKVYKGTCSICHRTGLNSAPRMGSKKDWEPRLAQKKELLYSRALNGYRGSKGSMPSRGSNPRLSDSEIKAAVDYMVEHAIPAWSVD